MAEKLKSLQYLQLISGKKISPTLTGEWISVHSYKGKTYAYYPSEPFFNVYLRITDSTVVINEFNEGLVPYAIRKITTRKNKTVFTIVNASMKECKLVFVQRNDGYMIQSSLFNKSEIRVMMKPYFFKLPIIVNHCPDYRCEEFQFR